MKRYFIKKSKIIEFAKKYTRHTDEEIANMGWIDKLDGQEAYFPPEFNITMVGPYHVHRDWCVELEVID